MNLSNVISSATQVIYYHADNDPEYTGFPDSPRVRLLNMSQQQTYALFKLGRVLRISFNCEFIFDLYFSTQVADELIQEIYSTLTSK